jgi:hypothetical protein
VQLCGEDEHKDDHFFLFFPSNGAPVEWNWQGKTEVLGGKTWHRAILSATNPTRADPGSSPGPNRLSHTTATTQPYHSFFTSVHTIPWLHKQRYRRVKKTLHTTVSYKTKGSNGK